MLTSVKEKQQQQHLWGEREEKIIPFLEIREVTWSIAELLRFIG
jgi:hypothetical protein